MSGYRYDTSKIPTQQNQKYLKMNQSAIVVATSPKMTPIRNSLLLSSIGSESMLGKHLKLIKFHEMSKKQICLQKVYQVKGFYTWES